jgi:hypothetical protein
MSLSEGNTSGTGSTDTAAILDKLASILTVQTQLQQQQQKLTAARATAPEPARAGETWVATHVYFYGRSSTKGDLSASKYLEDISSRKRRFRATNTDLLDAAISGLRGEASAWFESVRNLDTDPSNMTYPTRSWDAFVAAFKEHYLIGGETHRINWTDTFVQRSGEDVSRYLARSANDLFTYLREVRSSIWTPALDSSTDVTASVADSFLAVLDEINNDTLTHAQARNKIRAVAGSIMDQHKEQLDLLVENVEANYHTRFVTHATIQGLQREDLRRYADQFVEKHKLELFTDRTAPGLLVSKILELERVNGKKNAACNSAAADSSDAAGSEHADVDAVSNKNKGKGKGNKGKGKGQQGQGTSSGSGQRGNNKPKPPGKPSNQCAFCNKAGHSIEQCFARRTVLQYRHKLVQENSVSNDAPTRDFSQAAALAHQQMSPGMPMQQQQHSGNGLLPPPPPPAWHQQPPLQLHSGNANW